MGLSNGCATNLTQTQRRGNHAYIDVSAGPGGFRALRNGATHERYRQHAGGGALVHTVLPACRRIRPKCMSQHGSDRRLAQVKPDHQTRVTCTHRHAGSRRPSYAFARIFDGLTAQQSSLSHSPGAFAWMGQACRAHQSEKVWRNVRYWKPTCFPCARSAVVPAIPAVLFFLCGGRRWHYHCYSYLL